MTTLVVKLYHVVFYDIITCLLPGMLLLVVGNYPSMTRYQVPGISHQITQAGIFYRYTNERTISRINNSDIAAHEQVPADNSGNLKHAQEERRQSDHMRAIYSILAILETFESAFRALRGQPYVRRNIFLHEK